MTKRRRKGAARDTRRASTSQPQKRRPAKRRAAPPAAVNADDDDVWTGPAKALPPTRQRTAAVQRADDDDVWTGPAKAAPVMLHQLEIRTVQDGSEYDARAGWWKCRYGCVGLKLAEDSPMSHHYTCVFWDREGKELAPF